MDQPVRILCTFSTLDRGGAESMCMNIYRHIDQSRVQFDFVKHTSKKGAFEDEITALGGQIFEAPRYRMINRCAYVKWWKKHLIAHPEHQIIHGHFFTISAVYFKAAKKLGRTTVGHSHCTPSDKKDLKNWLSNRLIGKIDALSDARLACSIPAGEWVYKEHPFQVLNNAIESERFEFDSDAREEVRKKFGLRDDFVVGAVGRIMHQKNPEGIVEIFRQVLLRKPNARLMWIGDGPMRTEAEAKLKEYGIADRVLMMGVRSDVNRLMQAMDTFIFPSFYEGLGVVAIEAQAAGLPCYISDVVPHEVKITDLCRFLPLGKPAQWADAICLPQPERRSTREEIIRAGYDIQTTAKWLCNFYEKLLQERAESNQ